MSNQTVLEGVTDVITNVSATLNISTVSMGPGYSNCTTEGVDSDWKKNYWSSFIEHPLSQQSSKIDLWLRLIELPIVCVAGLCGNALTLVLMSRSALRKQSFSRYLALLAICDTVSLFIRFLFWTNLFSKVLEWGIPIRFRTDSLCAVSEYLFTVDHILCSWLLVSVTIERVIVVSFPLSTFRICTPAIATKVLIGLVVFFFLLMSYVPLKTAYSPEIEACGMREQDMIFHYAMATTFVAMMPLALILLGNIWVVLQLKRTSLDVSHKNREEHIRHVTYMLLTVSMVFFVLTFPNALLTFLLVLRPGWVSLKKAMGAANVLWDLNYAINFYLYAITGKTVRNELSRICKQTSR